MFANLFKVWLHRTHEVSVPFLCIKRIASVDVHEENATSLKYVVERERSILVVFSGNS